MDEEHGVCPCHDASESDKAQASIAHCQLRDKQRTGGWSSERSRRFCEVTQQDLGLLPPCVWAPQTCLSPWLPPDPASSRPWPSVLSRPRCPRALRTFSQHRGRRDGVFLTRAPSPHFLQEKLQPGDPSQRTEINSRERGRASAASKAVPPPWAKKVRKSRNARPGTVLGLGCVLPPLILRKGFWGES